MANHFTLNANKCKRTNMQNSLLITCKCELYDKQYGALSCFTYYKNVK